VIFRRENAKIGASELKAFLREHLAGFKIPERILFSKDSLPQTATGKIDRRGLRQRQRYRDLIDTSIKGA